MPNRPPVLLSSKELDARHSHRKEPSKLFPLRVQIWRGGILLTSNLSLGTNLVPPPENREEPTEHEPLLVGDGPQPEG